MDIDYRLDGPETAPVLVLSNSLGTTWEMWDAQMAQLKTAFRVLRYNTRGHGGTPLPAGPVTLSTLGRDVVALLDSLAIKQAAFCGISLGGLTGLWLNRYAPERFCAIAVANTAAMIGKPDAWRERASLVRRQGMGLVAAGSAERWFTPGFCQRNPATVAALIAGLARQSPEGYAACCDALADADLRDALTEMTTPMLVIAGREDPVTGVAQAQLIVSQARRAQLLTLPASHLSNVACPRAFSEGLITFITEEAHCGANH